ncbi:MAG: AMP-binding protein, partial [Ilumatobacteraceae bacterium]
MNDTISTLGDIVRTHAHERGDRRALVAGDRSWTYDELYTDSCRAANALATAGVGSGDRVAFLDRNVPEYFAFLYGTAMLNAATVSVNWRLAAPEMNWILDNAEAKVLLIGAEFLGHLAQMSLTTVTTVVVVGDPGDSGYATWEQFCATASTSDPQVECGRDDTCYQLYTSGTTGLPKGVELTNRNMFGMLPVTADEWQMDADTVNLVAMPLFHIAGSGYAVAGMYFGAETILMREVDPVEILAAIPEHRVTNALFVP